MNPFFETHFIVSEIKNIAKYNDENSKPIHRNRPFHGFVLFKKGVSNFCFEDGNNYKIYANQVIYLPKFSNYTSIDEKGTECIVINFNLSTDETTFPFFFLSQSFGEKYKAKFEKILHMWKEQQVGYLNGCTAILYDIIYQIQQDARRSYRSSDQLQIVDNALLYIHNNLSNSELTVSEIAENQNISPEYLRRIFKSVRGISPVEYITTKRIDMAKGLLETGEIKLSSISERCGFFDYPYFSRVFKKRVGISPSKFIKSKN